MYGALATYKLKLNKVSFKFMSKWVGTRDVAAKGGLNAMVMPFCPSVR